MDARGDDAIIRAPLGRMFSRRRLLHSATALTAAALAACGGLPVSTNTPRPEVTIATAVLTPLAAATPTDVPTAPLIVFAGASITAGLGVQQTDAFPAKTIVLLAPVIYDAVNLAVSGETVRTWDTTASAVIDPRYAARRAANIVVFYAGLNDLHAGASVDETVARIVSFGQGRRRAGFKVVIGTLLPSTIDLGPGKEYEIEGQAVNATLRAQVADFADALADFGADPIIGTTGAATNRAYYQHDGIHPTSEGHGRIAAVVAATIQTL